MSTPDQILSARIAAVCRRHCARGVVDDLDAAIAELREIAGSRPDLLAEHAGVCLGWAQDDTPAEAPCFQAEAELCRTAGAPADLIEKWISVGRERVGGSRQAPYGSPAAHCWGRDTCQPQRTTLG